MGNQPSKPPSRSITQQEKDENHQKQEQEREREKELEKERQRERQKQKDKEKKVNRRISFQALSHGKATAADPSASTDCALAQTILQPPAQKPNLHQRLQTTHSHSPEQNEKGTGPAGRAISPAGIDEDEKELEYRPKDQPLPTHATEVNAEPSIPMDVPGSASVRPARRSREGSTASNSTPPALTPHYTPISSMQRPPRLPLAIDDEVRAPDSPPLEPPGMANEEVSMFDDEEPDLPRKSSMLSSATMDDEDVGNELQPYAVDTGGVNVVPTRIDWKGRGEKVYVTGTFAHWDRKFRLHKSDKGGMTATIEFPPGTHHLKFIVDGEMVPSPDLPTTVDIHNVLVNYIEVVADEPPRGRRESVQKPREIPANLYPPIVLPEEENLESGEQTPEREEEEPLEPPEEEIPIGDFRQLMPQALVDMELPENDPRFRQAYNIINDTPGPPSLPLFLGKSILNGILPHKDDNSVLTLPNHTVLNHLATSSIKNGVLATSVTTRYKKKYVTTIMYKPTFEANEAY